MLKSIHSPNGQKPIGPYAQAVVANGFVFCSGTAGVDPKTGKLVRGLENQTRQVFKNLNEALHAAHSDISKVIKVTVFLKNMKDFEKMNAVYKKIFRKHTPARTTIEVSNLAKKGALIVAESIAVVK